MRYLIGLEDTAWRQGRAVPVITDTDKLANGHMMVAGMSGTGKSHQMISYLTTATAQGIECDVFDVHEELHKVPGSVAVKFSEATQTGYNPLVLNLNPHSGGVRKQIVSIIDMVNRTSRKLGPRQETALRHLLEDVYYFRGILPDEPRSWVRKEITERQFDEIVRDNRYDQLRGYYPILRDVISYALRQLKAMRNGSDSRCVNALEKVEKIAARLASLNTKFRKATSDEEVKRLEAQMAAEKEKAKEVHCEFIDSIETGREMTDIHRFTNKEVLEAVVERLEGLQQGGIFCSNPPDWQGATTRIYHVGSLPEDEMRLLFYVRARQILRECQDAGETTKVRRIILVDEGHLYYSEDPDNPLNRIAKEGRKFGLALVVGSQSPTHFSEDFITNCATVLLTGISGTYWDMTCRKMQIDRAILTATRPQEVVALKLMKIGEPNARFINVMVRQDVIQQGIEQLREEKMRLAAA